MANPTLEQSTGGGIKGMKELLPAVFVRDGRYSRTDFSATHLDHAQFLQTAEELRYHPNNGTRAFGLVLQSMISRGIMADPSVQGYLYPAMAHRQRYPHIHERLSPHTSPEVKKRVLLGGAAVNAEYQRMITRTDYRSYVTGIPRYINVIEALLVERGFYESPPQTLPQ